MSRTVRQLVDERAEDGNVTAIRSLLAMERQRDPRKVDALQRMAEGRSQ